MTPGSSCLILLTSVSVLGSEGLLEVATCAAAYVDAMDRGEA